MQGYNSYILFSFLQKDKLLFGYTDCFPECVIKFIVFPTASLNLSFWFSCIYFENIFLIRTVQKCFYLPRKKVFCYYFENDSVFQLQPKLFFFVVIKSFSPFSKFFLHFEFFFLFFDFEIYFLTLKKIIYFEKVFFGMFRLPWKTNVLVSNFFFSVFD